MVTDPADFIGRAEQMEEICSRLDKMESTSIVGERRIGKSSLLYQLALTGKERLAHPAYRFFYIDLQDARCHTALGFFQTVLGKLGAAADAVKEGNSLNRNLIAFGDGIEALERDGQRIVLCLDEFENTFRHPAEFGDDFFDHLRSLVNVRRFAMVTASRQTLQALSLAGKLTSPFYNLLSTIELKEFTEAEAQEFIAVYHARVQFTDAELQFLFSYLDPHPLKLRILCDWVFKNRQKQLADWALAEEIAKEYGNFIIGKYDPKQLLRAKRALSLDNINKLLDVILKGRGLFKGSDK